MSYFMSITSTRSVIAHVSEISTKAIHENELPLLHMYAFGRSAMIRKLNEGLYHYLEHWHFVIYGVMTDPGTTRLTRNSSN
jgi:hypothetical protein